MVRYDPLDLAEEVAGFDCRDVLGVLDDDDRGEPRDLLAVDLVGELDVEVAQLLSVHRVDAFDVRLGVQMLGHFLEAPAVGAAVDVRVGLRCARQRDTGQAEGAAGMARARRDASAA